MNRQRPDPFALKGVKPPGAEAEEGELDEEDGDIAAPPLQGQEEEEQEDGEEGGPAVMKPGFVERLKRLATTASPPLVNPGEDAMHTETTAAGGGATAAAAAAATAAAAPPPPPPPPPPVAPVAPVAKKPAAPAPAPAAAAASNGGNGGNGGGGRSAATLSSFARKLLAAPRERKEVEVPEAIPLNDYILEGFGKTYRRRLTADEGEGDSDGEGRGGGDGGSDGGEGRGRKGLGSDEDGEGNEDEDGDGDGDVDDSGRPPPGGGGVGSFKAVRAWNLWWHSTEATVRAAFGEHGELERLEMLKDRDTQRFRGVVIATYKTPKQALQALERLHESVIDNRTVFLEPSDRGLRRGSAKGRNDSRYFLLDKTLFCRQCHGVGHTAKFCPNPAKAKPCTACAGTDGHEAAQCPERVAGPVGLLCLICGGTDHNEAMGCDRRDRAAGDLKGNANIRCLRCAELGHGAICGPQAHHGERAQPPRYVYCHRCGGAGHFGPDCDVHPPRDPVTGQPRPRNPQLRRHSYHGKHSRFDHQPPPPPPPPPDAYPGGMQMAYAPLPPPQQQQPPPPPPGGGYYPPPPPQYDPPPPPHPPAPAGGGYYPPPQPFGSPPGGYPHSPPRRGGSRGRDGGWEEEDYGRDRQRRRSDRY